MESMNFKILEKFKEQKQRKNKEHQELVRREMYALEELQALKAEYEKLIVDSLKEGKDSTKKLDELNEKIEKAKTAHERRQKERNLYSTISKEGDITSEDVIKAWQNEYIPAFKEQKFNPILEQLFKAKLDYINAVFNYFDVLDEYSNEKSDAVLEIGDHYRFRLGEIRLLYNSEIDRHFLTERDSRQINQKTVPDSVKYDFERKK